LSDDRPATRGEIANELLACLTLVAPSTMGADERAAFITVGIETLSELSLAELKEGARQARKTCRFPSELLPAIFGNSEEARETYISASGYIYRGDERAVMREAEKRADWSTYYQAKARVKEETGTPRIGTARSIGKLLGDYR
jgi:hypothetical protein